VQAKLWCELGRSFEANGARAEALQAYTTAIDQFRYYPDCHFFYCRLTGERQACEVYLTLAPRGQYATEARNVGRQ